MKIVFGGIAGEPVKGRVSSRQNANAKAIDATSDAIVYQGLIDFA